MKTITVEVDEMLCKAYQDFSDEYKQHFNEYVSRVLQKVATKARFDKLRETVEELQREPGCTISPEVLYLLFQGEEGLL
jgi:hypothetical protein